MAIKMKNNNQHLAETHEEDFLNDLLIQAGFNPEEDNFEELKDELEIPNYDEFLAGVFEEFQEEYLANMELPGEDEK